MNLSYCGTFPDRDHTHCPSSVECTAPEAPRDWLRTLMQIAASATLASAALADEREGDFRYYVTDLARHAASLDAAVRDM